MSDAAELALDRAGRRVLARLQALEVRLEAGDDSAWEDYLTTIQALLVITRERRPGQLLTTKELAQRLGVNERTVRRHREVGALTPVLARGRVIRWAADSVPGGTTLGTARPTAANDARGPSLSRAVRGERQR